MPRSSPFSHRTLIPDHRGNQSNWKGASASSHIYPSTLFSCYNGSCHFLTEAKPSTLALGSMPCLRSHITEQFLSCTGPASLLLNQKFPTLLISHALYPVSVSSCSRATYLHCITPSLLFPPTPFHQASATLQLFSRSPTTP